MTIHVPSFDPATSLNAPSGATHFRLSSTVGELDFTNETTNTASAESTAIPITSHTLPEMDLTSILTGTSNPLLMSLGIQFFQMIGGQLIPLYNTRYNAISIVAAEGKLVASVKALEIEQANSIDAKSEGKRFSSSLDQHATRPKRALNNTHSLSVAVVEELTLHYDIQGNPKFVSAPPE